MALLLQRSLDSILDSKFLVTKQMTDLFVEEGVVHVSAVCCCAVLVLRVHVCTVRVRVFRVVIVYLVLCRMYDVSALRHYSHTLHRP